MCRQPGCRYFCTRPFTISPSYDKFAVENDLYMLAPAWTKAMPFQTSPNRVKQAVKCVALRGGHI